MKFDHRTIDSHIKYIQHCNSTVQVSTLREGFTEKNHVKSLVFCQISLENIPNSLKFGGKKVNLGVILGGFGPVWELSWTKDIENPIER